MIQLRQLAKSIGHALRGVRVTFVSEQSFRVQVFIAIAVVIFAFLFDITALEWILLLILIGSVLSLELINSIFERIIDTFKPRIHPAVKDIKDMMAGAVFIASIISAAVGLIIFFPYFVELVRSWA